jgi:hypothetical protein
MPRLGIELYSLFDRLKTVRSSHHAATVVSLQFLSEIFVDVINI